MDKILETIEHEFSKSNDVINLAKQYQKLNNNINDIFILLIGAKNTRHFSDEMNLHLFLLFFNIYYDIIFTLNTI